MSDDRPRVSITVDGTVLQAPGGVTLAAALLTAPPGWRATPSGRPRVLFCGMGLCFECWVTVEGLGSVRSCLTTVAEGMRVTTGPTRS